MVRRSLAPVLDYLTQASGLFAEVTDAQLLNRFVAAQDERAFTEITRRHGALVLGVGRRVLGVGPDAEDVFQATFLLLARKAGSIRAGHSLAAWLHGTAYRTALNARKSRLRRQKKEREAARQAAETRSASPGDAAALRDLQAVLDQELTRLPEAFRAAFVLCVLEGRTRAEAAAALGCTEGTVSSRLARARAALQKQLARRGLAPAAALGGTALAEAFAGAAVPAHLFRTTARVAGTLADGGELTDAVAPAVATLIQGVSNVTTYKTTLAAALLTCALGLGGAGFYAVAGPRAGADGPRPAAERAAPAGKAPEVNLEGTWRMTLPAGFRYDVQLERVGDRLYLLTTETRFAGLYQFDGNRLVRLKPKQGVYEKFVWELRGGDAAELVEEPPSEKTGAQYTGATLRRGAALRGDPPRAGPGDGRQVRAGSARIEIRLVVVEAKVTRGGKPVVMIRSDVKEERADAVGVAEAVAILEKVEGWGSTVGVYVAAARDVPPGDRKKLLGAILKNPWLELEYFGHELPKDVAERTPDLDRPEPGLPRAWNPARFPRLSGKVTRFIGHESGYLPPQVGDPFTLDFGSLDVTKLDFDPQRKSYIPLPGVLRLELVNAFTTGAFQNCRFVAEGSGGRRVKLDVQPRPGRGDPRFVEVWITVERQGLVTGVVVVECLAEGAFPPRPPSGERPPTPASP